MNHYKHGVGSLFPGLPIFSTVRGKTNIILCIISILLWEGLRMRLVQAILVLRLSLSFSHFSCIKFACVHAKKWEKEREKKGEPADEAKYGHCLAEYKHNLSSLMLQWRTLLELASPTPPIFVWTMSLMKIRRLLTTTIFSPNALPITLSLRTMISITHYVCFHRLSILFPNTCKHLYTLIAVGSPTF